LRYAQSVRSPWKKKDIRSIENVQRRATKMIPGLNKISYEERLTKMELPTPVYRRARGDMIETYKMMHGKYDEDTIPHG
jgi:hypothetical protein